MTATDIDTAAHGELRPAPRRPPGRGRGSQLGVVRPTGRAADGLASVDPQAWDGLIGSGSAPLRHGFLTAWEHSDLPGLRSRPVIAEMAGEANPLAACPGYFYDLDVPTVRAPQLAPALAPIRRLWPRFLVARTYELGSPTPLVNPFLVADEQLRAQAVPALIEAALAEGAHEGADFILVQNFTSERGPAAAELKRQGFAMVAVPPAAVVDLPYKSFEDYLAAMRAQYRRRAQQTLKRSASLSVEHLTRFDHLADELARLWRCIYDRAQEVKREILTPDFFRLASAVEGVTVLLTRRPDDSVASFALLIDDDPWLSFVQCGFETSARGEGAYFRLLYEIVRYGIENGYEQVDLGITTLTPKLDVGAVPVPLFAWLRHGNRLAQRAIRGIADSPLMRPSELAPRRVFKQDPAPAAELVRRRRLVV